jgi:hypothetical protein
VNKPSSKKPSSNQSKFVKSAIALAVASALYSTPGHAQLVAFPPPPPIGTDIRNPVTGLMEQVLDHPDLPFGTVRTVGNNYIWYGPRTVGEIFDIPAQAAIPATADYPGQAALSARRVRVETVTLQDDNDPATPPANHLVNSITFVTLSGDASPSAAIDFVEAINVGPLPAGRVITPTPGLGEGGGGFTPPAVPANSVNAIYDPVHGQYGDNGSDGWGFEICFFGCWTVGDDADAGDPGSAPAPRTFTYNAANLAVQNGGQITATGVGQSGIAVLRQGGDGGSGGDAWGALRGANGGAAGAGGQVNITSNVDITTSGDDGHGMWIQSRAGYGGAGGGGYLLSTPGGGGPAALAGDATGTNNGDIVTTGESAVGLFVQSIGGGGGTGGDAYGVVGNGGHASQGGNARTATARNNGTVQTGIRAINPLTGLMDNMGQAAHGVFAQSVGGSGGNAGDGGGFVGLGGTGETGGDGQLAWAINGTNAQIRTIGHASHGLYAQSVGGGGGDGGSGAGITGVGGAGSGGGNGGEARAENLAGAEIFTLGDGSFGMLAQSIGGGGGNGGNSGGIVGIGGGGTSGGQGGAANANNRGTVTTLGDYSHGVVAQSIGGGGGSGGNGDGLVGLGGGSNSLTPNHGGLVRVENFLGSLIHTEGQSSYGVLAQSIGGGGGSGAGSGGLVTVGGSGGAGGNGSTVTVINRAVIETIGADGKGIVAQSIGGGGGSASASTGAVELGGVGAGGGNGQLVIVENYTNITTQGRGADGIFAQSIGGGGGNGASSSGVVALGGSGAGGGNGGAVNVTNSGSIVTQGSRARGIMAESVGGGGGSGGEGDGLVAIGGSGGAGGGAGVGVPNNSGDLTVVNGGVIVTLGAVSSAIEARSVGGGGGSGGNAGSNIPGGLTIGGTGGDGGNAGFVDVTNNRDIATLGNDSHGIFAQAIGGGGGNGGNTTSVSLFGGASVGASAGDGGDGNIVTIRGNLLAGATPTIETHGDRAKGIFAQSVGGGGGNGGFAIQATAGLGVALSTAIGGEGGFGGIGRLVDILATQNIRTSGQDSDGILAQSIGGGGGNGGFAMAYSGSTGPVGSGAVSASIGGRGGSGGAGGVVNVDAGGSIVTSGDLSEGLIAQSVGGGGGSGGYAISVAASGAGGAAGAVSAAIGGTGGDGGAAGQVEVDFDGDITTLGQDSTGVIAQAIGGGGGSGGYAIAGSLTGAGAAAASVSVGVGGAGGGGGVGGVVDATITGNLATAGDRSTGMVVQSVGGRGGNGGFSVAGAISGAGAGAAAVSVGVGGSGGGGGNADTATGALVGDATTLGSDADAVLVQSIGGGGGNGGFNASGSIAGAGAGAGAVAVGVGGAGGGAGAGLTATGTVTGHLSTTGDGSNAFVTQSIGGGGGNGGFNASGGIAGAGGGAGVVSVGVGGAGGGGGAGGVVAATLTGSARTRGDNATAIVAQSIGGGGGNGGFAATGAIAGAGGGAGAVSVGVGGSGGGGGGALQTTLTVTGDTLTEGINSGGVLAQSVGGGGGNGGFTATGAISGAGGGAGAVSVGVGGAGGTGAHVGGVVTATVEGNIVTRGANSVGLTAQSIGGGGGNGGFAAVGAISGAGTGAGAVAVGVGGSGGGGGSGGAVVGTLEGDLETLGDGSDGVVVQSIGGGGGNGGFTAVGAISGAGTGAGSVSVGVGGSGGGAGNGGLVTAVVTGDVQTSGDDASSVIAQSIGGGGGNGGFTAGGGISAGGTGAGAVGVGIGGSGGGGGNGNIVHATVTGNAITRGENATAVVVQSLGGGGGTGGMSVVGTLSGAGTGAGSVSVGLGGAGGGGGISALTTLILSGDVNTVGDGSSGILVQSVGGGGGAGGMTVAGAISGAGQGAGAVAVGVGGSGGLGGDGNIVSATTEGTVITRGERATAFVAQSIGGGGGAGGMNVTGAMAAAGRGAGSVAVGVGGVGGGGGDGRAVTADHTGNLATLGADSHGALFQSVGGGGGTGGMNISAGLTAAGDGAGTLAVGVGGAGGDGGDAALVTGTLTGDASTAGDGSFGVALQSVGGGGGNGGMNITGVVSLSKGPNGSMGIGVGGFGGDGGDAGGVLGVVDGDVTTQGRGSIGVLAQSVGGGGGNGGINITGAMSIAKETSAAAALGVGGFGGGGGDSALVTLTRIGATHTSGAASDGVVAQSIGGGGGNGGMNISASLAGSTSGSAYSLAGGVGGFGGDGGEGRDVIASVTGDVFATGYGTMRYVREDGLVRREITDGSNGVLAQSIGGSGGNGGINIAGGIALDGSNGSSHALILGVGGFGGGGGDAGAVTLNVNAALVQAIGDNRFGVGAQSVGGGGGRGGMNISGGIAMDGVLAAGVGGFGGDGGVSGAVTATADTNILVVGADSIGFMAQSIGGGGGAGGVNVSGALQTGQTDRPTVTFGIGGFGGAGNVSSTVNATQHGDIVAQGNRAIGVLAQSVAGGGGAGGMNITGNLARGTGYNATVSIGGSAGAGANAQRVDLVSNGNIAVDGRELVDPSVPLTSDELESLSFRETANGILVQSIGGGGGVGGANFSGVVAPMGDTIVAGVGGSGGGGGNAGDVFVRRGELGAGLIETFGHRANGLTAQSVGGGGGNAGINITQSLADDDGSAFNFGMGGDGANPGNGALVDVLHIGTILTRGDRSTGLLAQSVGGGGGNADFNIATAEGGDTGVNVGIGGRSGPGGDGGDVFVDHTGNISTLGRFSHALFAQSVGGGGGSTGTDFVSGDASDVAFSLGRSGGTGGNGGDVRVDMDGMLTTVGDRSIGIKAQSVGLGGGDSSSTSGEVSGGDEDDGSDWAISVEVGIAGATGGVAGEVRVFAEGGISTQGRESHGIHAQSVGGGGGDGGAIERQPAATASHQVQVGLGGSGGDGGIAHLVLVDSGADISTSGDKSHGIFAQSIGGGGGNGGYSATVDLEGGNGGGGNTLAVSLGGDGGTGSIADTADVTNRGNILTRGRESHGVNAESLGGGGGSGGAVLSVGRSSGDVTRALSVSIGGSGGDGGVSDDVTVVNEGRISTLGDNSSGIRAKSIGGKGGDAGLILNLGIQNVGPNQSATRLTVNVGGDGGTGGVAGNVNVMNRAQAGVADTGVIVTEGRESHGIFAQSLGGGGGNGSSIITSNAGLSNGGQLTLIDLAFGGRGGNGSEAGTVTVTNDSLIDTAGVEAHGIFAQSIGGGGGNGGLVLAANAVLASGDVANEAMITIGGAGGTGDDAGDVTVNNSGRIVTRGERSHGIFAQSIGGGGGNAGLGFGLSSNPASMVIAGALSAAFGGRGGDGGLGGHVTVNHSGDITVLGNGARAIVAESINGGGGHVTFDLNGVATLPGVPDSVYNVVPLPAGIDAADPRLVFFGGGQSQQDSNAGNVTLNVTGTFGVAGNNGAANSVQAIGGGGGTFDLTLNQADVESAADDVDIEGRLGGVDGQNNRGGDVGSVHNGDLVTEGDNSQGALVQSIGGGGGRANLDLVSQYDSVGTTDITLGGENGENEEGGNIQHTQNGSVSTQGSSAHGGVFQSVGGGGGSLSLLASDGVANTADSSRRAYKQDDGTAHGNSRAHALNMMVPQLSFGADGGTLLKGGNIGLILNGNVGTQGANAVGLVFQSVGAGGGVANVLGVDGLVVSLGGSNGASGDGGALDVLNTGNVFTLGERAHGVFLQSIGGGGSAVFTDAASPTVTLSSGNVGNGGAIVFAQNGTIVTQGARAYGLYAQSVGGGGGYVDNALLHGGWAGSAGGVGTAGAIDLALNGNIGSLGEGSTALFAQSTGANGLGGNITAALSAGNDLIGGANGVAVHFDGGAANRFTNRGNVATLSGIEGFAFRGGAGGDAIDNFGSAMGNLDLGTGTNAFSNHIDAAFYSGTTVNLGDATNVLRNEGLIAPGAQALAVHTRLSGSYLQTAAGRADMEIDFALREGDRITATGTANVSGTLSFSLLNTQMIRPGQHFQPLFIASGGANDRGIAFNPQHSIVIDYRLINQNPNALGVQYEVDFNADGLTGNRREVGEYLNRVQLAGGPGGLGDTITTAVLQTELEPYAFMLTQLGAEFYTEQQALALKGVQRFARNLQNCGTYSIAETTGDSTGCWWGRYDDNPSTRDSRAGFPSSKDEGFSISQGLQKPRDDGWVIGVGIDIEKRESAGFDGLWTADSSFVQLGASLRRDFGSHGFGATLALGNNSQDVTRMLGVTDVTEAEGNRNVYFASSVLDYTYGITVGGLRIEPSFNLGTSLLSYSSMAEQGADSQNAIIHDGSEVHLWAEPALGARYDLPFLNGDSLRLFARAGMLHYFSGTSSKVRAGLEGAPVDAAPMRTSSDLDRTHFVGEAGMQLSLKGGFTMSFSYAMQESKIREGGAGSFRFTLPLR